MPKLHELLSVRGVLKGQAEAARGDLANTFEKKRQHFTERRKTFKSNREGVEPVTEEQLELVTTVPRELRWIAGIWTKAIDVAYSVEFANTFAAADIVLESGFKIATRVPAPALLDLEKTAQAIVDFVKKIPTLDPAKGFKPAPDKGADIFVALEDRNVRTQKIQEPLVLAPATDKHPAQVQLVSKDVEIGTILVQEWSGLITTAMKGDMLERAEELKRAIKRARSQANDGMVTDNKIGAVLFDYVFTNVETSADRLS